MARLFPGCFGRQPLELQAVDLPYFAGPGERPQSFRHAAQQIGDGVVHALGG